MTEWLEKYLQDFKGGLLIVSHDRKFLDNVATRILEMEGGHLQSFKGNYTKYMAQKEIQTRRWKLPMLPSRIILQERKPTSAVLRRA